MRWICACGYEEGVRRTNLRTPRPDFSGSSMAVSVSPPHEVLPTQEHAVPGRADQDLVEADVGRCFGDEADGAAEIFRRQHAGHLLLARRGRAVAQDGSRDLAGA